MSEMTRQKMQELFKATASVDSVDGERKFKEYAQALTTPILQEIKLRSVVRELFAVEMLGPGAQAVYPVADDFDVPVWVLPGLGY